MTKHLGLILVSAAIILSEAGSQSPTPATNRAIIPVSRFDSKTWTERHNRFVREAKQGGIDILFLGDSLTANWEKYAAVWRQYFGGYRAAAFGIGGDQTENLLWRLQNGELDGLNPKLVILLIGTNNMSKSLNYTPADIAEGIRMNIAEIQKRAPQSKILLISILPRVVPMDDWLNIKNIEVNRLLTPLADGDKVIYVDAWKPFLNPDGTVKAEYYLDKTHLSETGYAQFARVLAQAVGQIAEPPVN